MTTPSASSSKPSSAPNLGKTLHGVSQAVHAHPLVCLLILGLMVGGGYATFTVAPGTPAVPSAASHVSSLAPAASAGTWTNFPNDNPPTRFADTMTYDAADGYTVLFGGCGTSACPSNDTWIFEGGTWTQIFPHHAPSPRMGGQIAYDAKDGYVLLFGGYGGDDGIALQDTWEFKAGQWTQIYPNVHPTARAYGYMAYDAKDGYVVLFGGTSNGTSAPDSWTFTGGQWTALSSAGAPSPRSYGSTAYDTHDGYIVLFGGAYDNGTEVPQTWTFSGGTWTEVFPSVSPPDLGSGMLSDDPALGGVLGFGEGWNYQPGNGTWLFSGGQWAELSVSNSPPADGNAQLTYDAADGYVVMFGGQLESGGYGNTWVFSSSTSPILSVDLESSGSVDLGSGVSFLAVATGGSGGDAYAWSTSSADLGCPVSTASSLACTPTVAGVYWVRVNVTDSASDTATSSVTLTVYSDIAATLTASPPSSEVGSHVLLNASASGGDPSGADGYTWGLFAPNASFSCSLDQQGVGTAQFACDPLMVGSFLVYVHAVDAAGGVGNASLTYTVVGGPAASQPVPSLPEADVGQTVTFTSTASGGTGIYPSFRWLDLPSGCSGATTGTVSCALSEAGTFDLAAQVTDSAGATSAWSSPLVYTVQADPVVALSGSVQIFTSQSTTVTSTVAGGVAPYAYSWTLNGTAVSGSSSSWTGSFAHGGTYTLVLTVTDATGTTAVSGPTQILVVLATPSPPPPAKQTSSYLSSPAGLAEVGLLGAVLVAALALGAVAMRRRRGSSLPPASGQGLGAWSPSSGTPNPYDGYQVPRGPLGGGTPGTPQAPPIAPRPQGPQPETNDSLRDLL